MEEEDNSLVVEMTGAGALSNLYVIHIKFIYNSSRF